ncbi:hypothetical protein BC830DRAFT_1085006 [Chytriomyces sp. MP71]|nr:hypothetical protein BC830DRAFT_1085006 [Chytriomyces sp. MP71]
MKNVRRHLVTAAACILFVNMLLAFFAGYPFSPAVDRAPAWERIMAKVRPDPQLPFPPIVHQVFLSHGSLDWRAEAEPQRRAWMQTWEDANKGRSRQAQLTHIVWDAASVVHLLQTRFDASVFEAYSRIASELHHVVAGDFVRYALLWYFGGIYADTDTICHRPIEKFALGRKDVEVIVAVEHASGFNKHNQTDIVQWTMIAAPRHPFLKQVLDSLTAKILVRDSFAGFKTSDILPFSGPNFWTHSLAAYLERFNESFAGLPHPLQGTREYVPDAKFARTPEAMKRKGDEAVFFQGSKVLVLPINSFLADSDWAHPFGIHHPLSFVTHKGTGSWPEGWQNQMAKLEEDHAEKVLKQDKE